MQPLRLQRWGSSILPLGTRQCCPHIQHPAGYSIRFQASSALLPAQGAEPAKRKRGRPRKDETPSRPSRRANVTARIAASPSDPFPPLFETDKPPSHPPNAVSGASASSTQTRIPPISPRSQRPSPSTTPANPEHRPSTNAELQILPSPPPARARKSAKLAALHARLQLPKELPLHTLARCLVDRTADPDPRFNNHSLAVLGNDLLGYYTTEHFIVHFPRLPQVVLEAAVTAHAGPKALAAVSSGWGIEFAAEPGGEVDPGLLQFRRALPSRRDARTAHGLKEQAEERSGTFNPQLLTPEHAASSAVRAILASVYLHAGADRVREFFAAHIMSRHLDLHSLFTFYQPTRDLSRLCAREGFESPVARLISETGRKSSAPVFVVGVYSGHDKIGEDAGASLDEARWKAAAKALKGWYLYSPKNAVGGGEIMVPSMMEGVLGKSRTWRKPHVDDGEVIV